jgi:hypothetical protein
MIRIGIHVLGMAGCDCGSVWHVDLFHIKIETVGGPVHGGLGGNRGNCMLRWFSELEVPDQNRLSRCMIRSTSGSTPVPIRDRRAPAAFHRLPPVLCFTNQNLTFPFDFQRL